jgi:hypothetical protein
MLAAFVLAVSLSFVQQSRAELTPGSKVYIQPFSQFETYLAAAFSKKHIPLVIVQSSDQADLKIIILNDGQRITGLRIENKTGEIVWTYVYPKPVKPQLKEAEKCASQLHGQFPISPEEQARREEQLRRREERRTELQGTNQPTQLCDGRLVVPAGSYLPIPFQVAGTATVQGSFEAGGGAGNDIQVIVGPRSEVLNWLNGHGGTVAYASEKLTSGTVNVLLTVPGDYLLVFSNTFSIISNKAVVANIQLIPQ